MFENMVRRGFHDVKCRGMDERTFELFCCYRHKRQGDTISSTARKPPLTQSRVVFSFQAAVDGE